jgi:hypothetical protein
MRKTRAARIYLAQYNHYGSDSAESARVDNVMPVITNRIFLGGKR